VSIHYNGDLSKRPGRQACTQRGAQAYATRWYATDCSQCKVTLLGLPLVKLDDATVTATVTDLDETSVLVERPAADGESAPDGERISFDAFDESWRSGGSA